MEEGREAKGPLRDRRDHGFDCGLGLAVITMTHRGVFDSTKTHKIEWLQGSQQRTLGHMARGRILVLGLVAHSGEALRCVNVHQTGYGDATRREIILENLTKMITESKNTRFIIGGDMNASNPGGRDGYSQNPVTLSRREAADNALLAFTKKIGGTLISPSGPTWRRGDGTQSATLDHVILLNFPNMAATATTEAMGDIQHDHLCVKVSLDSTIFGEGAPSNPPKTSTGPRLEAKTWSQVRSRVDSTTDVFNLEVEKKLQEGKLGASEAVEQILQNKLSTALTILAETRQRITTREAKRGPHKDREQRERLRDIATLQIALSVLKRPTSKGNGDLERR